MNGFEKKPFSVLFVLPLFEAFFKFFSIFSLIFSPFAAFASVLRFAGSFFHWNWTTFRPDEPHAELAVSSKHGKLSEIWERRGVKESKERPPTTIFVETRSYLFTRGKQSIVRTNETHHTRHQPRHRSIFEVHHCNNSFSTARTSKRSNYIKGLQPDRRPPSRTSLIPSYAV